VRSQSLDNVEELTHWGEIYMTLVRTFSSRLKQTRFEALGEVVSLSAPDFELIFGILLFFI
jgi:hypothetical protein